MALHCLFLPGADLAGDVLRPDPTGDECRHAFRVKRVELGQSVRVLNGQGLVIEAVVESIRPEVLLRVTSREQVPPPRPRVEVCSATPKGSRLEEMIEMLSQVGAASWSPLETARGVVEPGENKLARCGRVAVESAKQCGRAWTLEVAGARGLEMALDRGTGAQLVVADATGEGLPVRGCAAYRLLVGPEGGFAPEELELARRAGAAVLWLGPHTLRIETAAVVGASVLMRAGVAIPPSPGLPVA